METEVAEALAAGWPKEGDSLVLLDGGVLRFQSGEWEHPSQASLDVMQPTERPNRTGE